MFQFHPQLQHRLGGPHASRADENPRGRKAFHGVVESPVHLTHHVGFRQAHILQGKASGRDAHPPHVLEIGRRNTRRVLEGQRKERKRPVSGGEIGVRARQHQVHAAQLQRFPDETDERLFTV